MTNAYNTSSSPVLVAIDIAKHCHEVLVALPGKKRRKRMMILSNKDDYKRLAALLLRRLASLTRALVAF
ncbi:MAG: hypothetical protein JKY91_00015 [Emcibacter sp.]|nr:hypothetical protein [Emcibacter sp.]